MSDPSYLDTPASPNSRPQPAQPALVVSMGSAMPHTPTQTLPVLQSAPSATPARSMIAEGMHFVGHAVLRGPCTVAGTVEGNLSAAPDVSLSVVVTATGRVLGDITAQKISVMGTTEGILDAGTGEVALHDTASVRGLVRYGRIQVNGADLNATLERATPARPL
ncbi:MAG: hypothetical protein RLZZ352_2827 [Pseudomonadota bacterium]|jgi:cytoskeletal protein CcmA (bactofilin family)